MNATRLINQRRLAILAVTVLTALTAFSPFSTAHAQPAQAEIPQRNLQIEVRQSQSGVQSRSGVTGSGAIVLQPGNSGAMGRISGGSTQIQETRNLSQMMLVLNGRSTQMSLGNSVPVRLVQTFVRNGEVRVIPGTVIVQANSGFGARPVWRGGDAVDLEIGTALSTGNAASGASSGSSASSSLSLPIGEWVTIAESMDSGSQGSGGTFGQVQQGGQSSLQIQVRISVR